MTVNDKPAQRPLLRDLAHTLALVAACVVVAHLLAGCGGGDADPDVLLPSVSCTAGACA